jgi:phosphoribosylformimino-5-aminoimidazole carboxamide ribotide isomerase
MIVVPAIDIRRGRVVRLRQGRVQAETVYGEEPAEVARRWEAEGARRIHLVDLDAAIEDIPQPETVEAVVAAVKVPVEVGGGLRRIEDAQRYRDLGANRVIFGTAAVSRPEVVQAAVSRWPESVAVAIDARDGRVAVAGWNETTGVAVLDLAATVEGWGVVRVQYTDVRRDGTLAGPNLDAIEALGRRGSLRITAAGGVSDIDDLVRLAPLQAFGVDEVIVGKALYEGRLTLAAARGVLAARGGGC